MDYILPDLAIGGRQDAESVPEGIGRMLCVAAELDLDPGPHLYHKVPVVDMEPIPPDQIADAVRWLRDASPGTPALVYCNAGVGRSSSVVVAYLRLVHGLGFGQAVETVAVHHPRMSILPLLIQRIEAARVFL